MSNKKPENFKFFSGNLIGGADYAEFACKMAFGP
jgi:hypothetical protein